MGLSSFWSLGPMDFVVLLVLWSYGFVVLLVLGSWILSSFWSFGPVGLSSFWSLGPMDFVVLMVLRMDGCRCVECSVLREGRKGGKRWREGAFL